MANWRETMELNKASILIKFALKLCSSPGWHPFLFCSGWPACSSEPVLSSLKPCGQLSGKPLTPAEGTVLSSSGGQICWFGVHYLEAHLCADIIHSLISAFSQIELILWPPAAWILTYFSVASEHGWKRTVLFFGPKQTLWLVWLWLKIPEKLQTSF